MERRSGAPPKSLAQLIGRRGRAARSGWSTAEPTADALGQFGFLFADPEPPPPEEHEEPIAAQTLPRRLWSVAELAGTLRGQLERDFADVWVEGEISNAKQASSGALYLTLKDGDAQLPAVLFRRQASLLRWKPADGMAVLARGRVSVYESRGQLQLIVETLEPRGAGALQLQFEQLKERLRAEGLFDAEHKRPLPAYPATVGVVTSTQGAVIRDIVTVCRRRHGCLNILVYPAAVQGTGAAAEIAAGVRYFNESAAHPVDVIVVARGGGSTEDLWAFNDEALARTIRRSALPVVSAVGHETDFTIADFVADLRAPTPSAAAELITEAQHRAEERVDALRSRLFRGVRWQAMSARQRFTRAAATSALRRVPEAIDRRTQHVDALESRLQRAMEQQHALCRDRLRGLRDRMLRQDAGRRIANSRESLSAVTLRLQRAVGGLTRRQRAQAETASLMVRRVGATLTARQRLVWEGLASGLRRLQFIAAPRAALDGVAGRLGRTDLFTARRNRLERATVRLRALSPLAVLDRGYTLAFTGEGRLLRSVDQIAPGSTLQLRLADGQIAATVDAATGKKD